MYRPFLHRFLLYRPNTLHTPKRFFSTSQPSIVEPLTLDALTEKKLLKAMFISSLFPFMGFGWLDNSLMLLFGDQIEQTFCLRVGFSTMTAAALGNTLSDVAGVFMSARVEAVAGKLGFAAPALTEALRTSKKFVKARASGAAVGVFIGCLLGMWPLMFYDKKKVEEARLAESRREIFAVTVKKLCDVLKAKNGCLMLVDERKNLLYTEAEENSKLQSSITEISKTQGGIMGYVAATGKIVKSNDVQSSKFYDSKRHDNYHGSGHALKNVLCVPIKDAGGRVVGVIELANKAKTDHFTDEDEDVAVAVASHIAPRLLVDAQDFKDTISVCASNVQQRVHSRTRLSDAGT
jgi:hypothetical protein